MQQAPQRLPRVRRPQLLVWWCVVLGGRDRDGGGDGLASGISMDGTHRVSQSVSQLISPSGQSMYTHKAQPTTPHPITGDRRTISPSTCSLWFIPPPPPCASSLSSPICYAPHPALNASTAAAADAAAAAAAARSWWLQMRSLPPAPPVHWVGKWCGLGMMGLMMSTLSHQR